jgi:glycine/D-amino acid oxidase-like deaminating enzyme
MTETSTEGADVVVVGGGVVGCAVADELEGDQDVEVVEKGDIAGVASARAAGIIGLSAVYEDVPAVAAYASDFFERFDGTGSFEYVRRGRIGLVQPDDEAAERREAQRLTERGVPATYLTAAELDEKYPRFDTDGFAGGVEYAARPGKGWVDPYTFAVTLKDAAESAGATFRTGVTVTGVRTDDGEATGVETDAGPIGTSHVAVAAGWRTPSLLDGVVELPVQPYRTQCIVLEPETPLPDDFPMGWVAGEHVYFRPELNGDLLLGGWSFAEEQPESASESEDAEFRRHVARLVPDVFEGMADAEFVNGWAGIDGATPDQRPIVDAPGDAPDGLVVATGFHGRGVMTSPVAARAVRSLVTGADAPFPLETFAVDRFESRSPDFEFASISDH